MNAFSGIMAPPPRDPAAIRSHSFLRALPNVDARATGVTGVRSAAPFYAAVEIAPQPAHLRRIASRTPTPRGDVALDLAFDGNGGVAGTAALPPGLPGVFRWAGAAVPLAPGETTTLNLP